MGNQTFDSFYSIKKNENNNQIQHHLSPFSRKPVIHHLSPTLVGNKTLRVTSPVNMREVNMKMDSKVMLKKSPEKNYVAHSYNPSLVSYGGPTPPNQSLNNSPKKSFQSIAGLNSQIFSTTQNKNSDCDRQYEKQFSQKINNTAPTSGFFNMKKRQVNYGSIFSKQKSNEPLVKCQTIVKMGSQKSLTTKQPHIIYNQKETHQNPLAYKKRKSSKRDNLQLVDNNQNLTESVSNGQKSQFNLQERIIQNPLMNMLKKKLQQDGKMLGLQCLEQESTNQAKQMSFELSSQYNRNIRYSSSQNQPENCNDFRSNLVQCFPALHLLNKKQARQISESLENSEIKNSNDDLPLPYQKMAHPHEESRLSEKVQNYNESQYVIEQVQSCHKTMTIVRMLEQNIQNQQQNSLHEGYWSEKEASQEKYNLSLINMEHQYFEKQSQQRRDRQQDEPISNRQNLANGLEEGSKSYDDQNFEQNMESMNQSQMAQNVHQNVQQSLEKGQSQNGQTSQNRQIHQEQELCRIPNQQQTCSERHKMISTSHYQLFYKDKQPSDSKKIQRNPCSAFNQPYLRDNRPDKACNESGCFEQNSYRNTQRLNELHSSQYHWSTKSTLRSQRFKQISNKAYL